MLTIETIAGMACGAEFFFKDEEFPFNGLVIHLFFVRIMYIYLPLDGE